MARPLGFDRGDAEAALMRAFWAKGYAGTSLQDIEAATGQNKQSLYRLFGDKRGMYRAALLAYEGQVVAAAEAALAGPGSPRARIAALFDEVIDAACAGAEPAGCFLSQANAEADAADTATRDILQGMTLRVVAAFRRALRDDPRHAADPVLADAAALRLMAIYTGLRVMLKGGLDAGPARVIAAAAVADL